MPRGSATRVNGRSFAVREYAQWLNAMSDRQYDTMRNGYNTRGARRNIETFEDSLRSFDRELEEYLQMNRAAGFRSVPGPLLINNMLSMWLERDSSGEPAPGVADELRTDAERAGFRPVGGQGLGNRRGGYQSSPPRGGPRQRSPASNHRGGYRAGRGGGPRRRSPFDDRRGGYRSGPSGGRGQRSPVDDRRGGYRSGPSGRPHQRSPFDDVSDDDDFAPPRRRDPRSREPRDSPFAAPGGGRRGDHDPRRRVGAPPAREPRDRAYAVGPSRRSAPPSRGQREPSAGVYSGEESEDWSDEDF